MKLMAVCIALVVVTPHAFADDQVRAVQEELRRRNVYFGDVDGRPSQELEQAMRTYQKRKGFTPSGIKDRDTLRSLGLAEPSPNDPKPQELTWPEEPVLKSDIALDPEHEEQEIAAERLADAQPFAPAAPGAEEAPARGGRLPTTRGASRDRARGIPAPVARAGTLKMSERELHDFIRGYLSAASTGGFRSGSLEKEMPYFGDRVDYFDHGPVDRVVIKRTLQRYYARWPNRRYSLVGNLRYVALPRAGQVQVTFRTSFEVKNGRQKVAGLTDNTWVLEAATADPRIISMKERRVRR